MADKRDILLLASEIFSRRSDITSSSLQGIVEQGSRILAGLFRAEEARRDDRAARTLVSAVRVGAYGVAQEDQQEETLETFAEVLQRISRSLNTRQAPHTGTPPPTRNIASKSARVAPVPLNPPADLTINTLPTFDQIPWPFPSPQAIDETDLSADFFRDLGLLEGGGELGGAGDFWSQNLAGAGSASLDENFATPAAGEWEVGTTVDMGNMGGGW